MQTTGWLWVSVWIALLHTSVRAEPELVPAAPGAPSRIEAPGPFLPELAPPETPWDGERVDAAIDAVFAGSQRPALPDTRALLVVHRGHVVRERYAHGYGPDTLMPAWSLAKVFTQALVGVLVRKGELSLDAPVDLAAWREPGDPRRTITLRHLLQMTAGLDAEDVEGQGHSQQHTFLGSVLYGARSANVLATATAAPLLHEPGTQWAYSTAQTMIASALVQRSVGGHPEDLLNFIETELARPLGMQRVVPGFDAVGNFLGGSDVYLSARDWARLGLLYLRDGTAGGRRILPEGWVDFTRTPAPGRGNGNFGAQAWLPRAPGPRQLPMPAPTPRSFVMFGLFGQFVVVVPEADLVLVRLGTLRELSWEEVTGPLTDIAHAFLPTAAAK